jgi:formimidoylglutamate deiminase
VLADPQGGQPSTGERLWSLALGGGAAAAGLGSWGLQVGARADLLVLDSDSPSLLGIPDESLLDALVFSSPARPFRDVMVAGRWVSRDHRHPRSEEIAQQFKGAMQSLWQQEP